MMISEIGMFSLLIILWKCHSWTESIHVEQQKEEKSKKTLRLMKNVKVSWTDLFLQVVLVSLQRGLQLQAPKLSIVTEYVSCIIRCAIHKNSFGKKWRWLIHAVEHLYFHPRISFSCLWNEKVRLISISCDVVP